MACRDLHYLGIQYFRDPFQFADNRNIKVSPLEFASQRGPWSPTFGNKQTGELLWMDACHNPTWVQQDLRRSPIQDRDWKAGGADLTLKTHQEFRDHAALLDLIKSCGKQKDLRKGSSIHAHILESGLLKEDISLGNALISMYAKCGVLAKSQDVFDELPTRNVVTWNSLLAGYAQHGLGDEALSWYVQMRKEGLFPNTITFICILKACGSIGAAEKGEEIHAEVSRQGLLENNIKLGTALVDMYAKCGALAKAQTVFSKLPARDVALWNALIAGYAQHGLGNEALSCFGRMREEGLSPSVITFICVLKACSSIRAIEKGEEIHAEVIKQGLLEKDVVLGTTLVDMYAKCGELSKAQRVFDELPARIAATWTVLIAGYAQHGLGNEALSCFGRMRDEGISPDAFTFGCVLKACGSIGATQKGEEIHVEVGRQGLLKNDIVLGNALVDMYVKCGALSKAQEVFDELPARNVVRWNALIAGYAQHGLGDEALSCFARMQHEGFFPDAVTFICILKACGSIGAVVKGEEIHADVGRQGLLEKDIVLGTALVDMYAKCGEFEKAQGVFDELPARSVATWTALIAGYAQHGFDDEALSCFGQMQDEGLSPNAVTFICILKACSSIGAADKGEQIHTEVGRQGLLEKDIVLGTALVDMYAKCGALTNAQKVFDGLPARDVAMWTALIAGYAQVGKVKTVFDLFIKMVGEGIEPNMVTFVVLLTACSHTGLLEEGQMFFDAMSTVYCIIPTLEHRTCMIDIFTRAGHFDKAISVIENVPPSECLRLWLALMGACRTWVNVELGRWAFEHAIQLDEKLASAYVCMSNIYAAAGMQEAADEVEALRMKHRAWKIPSRCWWTDLRRRVNSFTVGDKSHPQSKFIYAKLKDIGQKLWLEGYSQRLHWVSQAISDKKEDVPCGHSENLAIACALINTPVGTTIRVVKNMRVCGDCHLATSLISKMENRKILVTDASRVHIFEDGKCFCED